MKIISTLKTKWTAWLNKRKQARYVRAVKIIEGHGLRAVRLVSVAGSNYIIDSTGAFRKIGRAEVHKPTPPKTGRHK